jgi:hypothetical protein
MVPPHHKNIYKERLRCVFSPALENGETQVSNENQKHKPLRDPKCDPADLLDEMDAILPRTSENISEVHLPEGTVVPDKETAGLSEDVVSAANEFRPLHEKLKTVIETHSTKIVLLKSKFGVRMGHPGYPMLVGESPMMWEEFVGFYFGVTARRLNQLLDVRDEKSSLTITQTPDTEKSLYRKGLAAGKQESRIAILSMEEKLAALSAMPDASKLAERVVILEAEMEERETDASKRIEELEQQNKQLLLNPSMSISEALREREQWSAPKPTIEGWKKNKYPMGEYKLKYFQKAARHFSSLNSALLSSATFTKALTLVGNPKHAEDLKTLAKLLTDAAADLRMLADAVDPDAKKQS